jgi:hypothetical protein
MDTHRVSDTTGIHTHSKVAFIHCEHFQTTQNVLLWAPPRQRPSQLRPMTAASENKFLITVLESFLSNDTAEIVWASGNNPLSDFTLGLYAPFK